MNIMLNGMDIILRGYLVNMLAIYRYKYNVKRAHISEYIYHLANIIIYIYIYTYIYISNLDQLYTNLPHVITCI